VRCAFAPNARKLTVRILQVATLNSEHNILINEKESVLVDARRLQHELDAAHTELSSQGKVVAKLQGEIEALRKSEEGARAMAKQLEAAQATLVQQTAASTFKNCEEGFKRELAQKSASLRSRALDTTGRLSELLFRQNELKRANNKLDESTKKLQKVLTELAKAKWVFNGVVPQSELILSLLAIETVPSSIHTSPRPRLWDRYQNNMKQDHLARPLSCAFSLPHA
jgi:chromosome segregation ATPase